jgi:hypothetical protein
MQNFYADSKFIDLGLKKKFRKKLQAKNKENKCKIRRPENSHSFLPLVFFGTFF